jgi:hypothetical protein
MGSFERLLAVFGGSFDGGFVTKKAAFETTVVQLTALLFAAAGRMSNVISMPPAVLIWLSPVILGIAYDKWTRRKVHPIYLVGLVILMVGFTRIFLVESEAWLRIGRGIVRAFG